MREYQTLREYKEFANNLNITIHQLSYELDHIFIKMLRALAPLPGKEFFHFYPHAGFTDLKYVFRNIGNDRQLSYAIQICYKNEVIQTFDAQRLHGYGKITVFSTAVASFIQTYLSPAAPKYIETYYKDAFDANHHDVIDRLEKIIQ